MTCDNPDCVEASRKILELTDSLNELIHLQLISRDQEIGLQNKVQQLVLDREVVQIELTKQFRQSLTWKIGLFFTWPFKIFTKN